MFWRRNIPAHAGKTLAPIAAEEAMAEHPRACGENGAIQRGQIILNGTSPRMRGKLGVSAKFDYRPRNIPAYAGKTHGGKTRPAQPAEHPRVCGENSARLIGARK